MRKLLVVKVKDKNTGEEKIHRPVFDFGHYWDEGHQYFRVLVGDAEHKTERIVLEPRHDFEITIEEE
jgi:hypothetical protein